MRTSLEQRLLKIKREIVALKTAHKRGLGTMRLFDYNVNPPSSISSDFVGQVTITATVSDDSSPYPLIDILASDFNKTLLLSGQTINNGMGYVWTYDVSTNASFKVISSSELSAINTNWEE